jgi:hypothetical protein
MPEQQSAFWLQPALGSRQHCPCLQSPKQQSLELVQVPCGGWQQRLFVHSNPVQQSLS